MSTKNMNGFQVSGDYISIEIQDSSTDRAIYIDNGIGTCTLDDYECVGIRGSDLELLYETLKEFLGK